MQGERVEAAVRAGQVTSVTSRKRMHCVCVHGTLAMSFYLGKTSNVIQHNHDTKMNTKNSKNYTHIYGPPSDDYRH